MNDRSDSAAESARDRAWTPPDAPGTAPHPSPPPDTAWVSPSGGASTASATAAHTSGPWVAPGAAPPPGSFPPPDSPRRGVRIAAWAFGVTVVAAILALTGLIVVVGGPDDEPARASEPTLLPPAPRVGLCFDSNADGVPVSLVRCDLPHHGEVILAFDLPEGPWPGVADLTEAGKRGCVRRFRQRWGTIEPVHGANIVLLPPTPQLWEKGLRSLHCALVLSDGAKIDHRVGDAPVPHRRLLELKVADCFAEAEGPRDPVNLVDCDRPHRGQAVKLLTLRDGLGGRDGAYPGDAKMRKFIEPKCIPVVQTAANRSTTDIDMEIRFLHPDREQWDDGERTAICLIWAPDKRLRESLVK